MNSVTNYLTATKWFIRNHIPSIIGLSAFYLLEISFGTVLLYMFALFGFLFTSGLMIIALVGFLTKDTMDENQRLKDKVTRLERELNAARITWNASHQMTAPIATAPTEEPNI